MRNLINIIQESQDIGLKKTIVDLIKSTDEESVLNRVLKILKAGNIEGRVTSILSKDADASKFIQRIAQVIDSIDAPIEEKNEFLEQYPKGIANTKALLSGNPQSFRDFLGDNDFTIELFKILTTELTSQGVGPGEVAMAIMSPKISWSGRVAGGGDIQIDGKSVELKTSVSSGGRWVNARKANMDTAGIKKAIAESEQAVLAKLTGAQAPMREMPDRLSLPMWVNEIRPTIAQDPKLLQSCTKVMADGLFNQTNNKEYQQALMTGGVHEIQMALLRVGYENYKAYSKFDGLMLMDLKGEIAQYFTEFDQMTDRIKIDTTYIYAPESEAMPKVKLLTAGGVGANTDVDAEEPQAPIAKPKSMTGGSVQASDLSSGPGASRERKKADLGRQRR
jgi:hypothetical protein